MKIFICCSKYFYNRISEIKERLENSGHEITLPNSYEHPFKEEEIKKLSKEEHIQWKSAMLRSQESKVKSNDAILVLNFDKNESKNYIGGATFLEIFKAFELNKKIFLLNPLPDNIFKDELTAINPIIINGDLSKIYWFGVPENLEEPSPTWPPTDFGNVVKLEPYKLKCCWGNSIKDSKYGDDVFDILLDVGPHA